MEDVSHYIEDCVLGMKCYPEKEEISENVDDVVGSSSIYFITMLIRDQINNILYDL